MNRISVLAAAGALGALALTAGCSSSTSGKNAGGTGSALGSTSSVASTGSGSGSGSGGSVGAGTVPSSGSSSSSAASSTGTTTASSPPTTATGTHSGGTACTTAEMPSGTWRVVPDSEGAGHIVADIALRNASDHTCTVAGFPGVSLLASNERPLPTNVVKDESVAVVTVKVAPGAWVHSEMRYSPNVPGPGEPQTGQCEPMTVHALAQLPGDTAWAHITLDNPTTVCEKGELQAKPFVSGQSSPTGG